MLFKRSFKFLGLALFVFSAVIFSQNNPQQNDPQQNNKMQKLYAEYQQISQELQSVQVKAFSDKDISSRSDKFNHELEKEMIKQDATIKGKLKKKDEIIDAFKTAETNGDQNKMTALKQKFQGISKDLQIAQQKAMKNPKLLKDSKIFQDALVAKMTKIEPKTPQLIARLESLGRELQGLSQTN